MWSLQFLQLSFKFDIVYCNDLTDFNTDVKKQIVVFTLLGSAVVQTFQEKKVKSALNCKSSLWLQTEWLFYQDQNIQMWQCFPNSYNISVKDVLSAVRNTCLVSDSSIVRPLIVSSTKWFYFSVSMLCSVFFDLPL